MSTSSSTGSIHHPTGPPRGNGPWADPRPLGGNRAGQLCRAGCRLAAGVVLAAVALGVPVAQACEGPTLQGSTVRLNAQLSNLDAEGIVGRSSKSSFLGFGRKKSIQDMPAVVEVGVLSMGCNAALIGSEIHINASANGIRLRGGTLRVGGVVMR